ncbi:hypothetical protein V1477_020100 [Vespula maculifrons]|uniref:Uncharacterized protein n=1 Tax=Vespula maculifrons TaxID=7453 RepID=A0ABD2ANR7_VESMC
MTMFHGRQLVWDKWILAFEVASCIRMTDLDIKATVYNDGCTIGVSIKERLDGAASTTADSDGDDDGDGNGGGGGGGGGSSSSGDDGDGDGTALVLLW